ncbi:MAG: hypothetical protein PHX61_13725, partial [Alphaproteobacteria bacterium]|nr:hypothetical protein [Alphaproteobacteria bacterium]
MYSNKRICPDEYKASFEDLLKEYVNIFTEDWLNSDTGHEIQKLWNRTDILASNELITLGVSIDKLKKVDPDWVKKQMNIIKTCEPNGRRGANYELILAAALHNINGQTVDLLHPQTPTYDLILNLSTGCKICISIKNFAHSKKSQEFEKEAKSIESMVKSNTQRAMQFIIRNDNFPDSGDWISLRRFLVHILKSDVNLNDNYECQYTTSKWEIILKSI